MPEELLQEICRRSSRNCFSLQWSSWPFVTRVGDGRTAFLQFEADLWAPDPYPALYSLCFTTLGCQSGSSLCSDATESCSLEDRYSALAMAEETAAEYGLMYVLPKYYELAAYRKLKAASCSNGPKFSVVHEADVSLHHLLHSPAWPLAPSIRAGQFKGMPCALKLVNLQRQPLSAAQLWHEIYMLRNPLQDLQGQAVPKLVGFGIIKGKGLAFMIIHTGAQMRELTLY
ncbi:hypothetical protein WJX84_008086 [Apatococcus fuscideae]|uniref:Uncharacterized protein n=1 Tax=Apatococcus fuscideae TaxID=2026836 RepID=A0AAW1T8A4_9CHLO